MTGWIFAGKSVISGNTKKRKNVRRNYTLIVVAILTCLNTVAVAYLIYRDVHRPENWVNHIPPMLKPSDVYCPDTFYLAGERVPLERVDVKEAFKRELITNTYLHSHTIQVLKNAPRYFPVIEPILAEEGIPDDFKYLAVIESSLNPLAVSPSGAVGLWQLMPATAKELKLEVNSEVDERYHIEKSTRAACAYLRKAYKKFGSWTLAAASYNGGMNMLSRQMKRQKADEYYDLLLNTETGRYVYRLLALKQIMEYPTLYDFFVSITYEKEPCTEVMVKKGIKNLADFAQEQGITYKTLKRFNPWLRQAYLNNKRHKTYRILIPLQKEKY